MNLTKDQQDRRTAAIAAVKRSPEFIAAAEGAKARRAGQQRKAVITEPEVDNDAGIAQLHVALREKNDAGRDHAGRAFRQLSRKA